MAFNALFRYPDAFYDGKDIQRALLFVLALVGVLSVH
jgi:hypothetical protein